MCGDNRSSPAADAAPAPVQANNPIQIVPDEVIQTSQLVSHVVQLTDKSVPQSTPDDASAIGEVGDPSGFEPLCVHSCLPEHLIFQRQRI